MEVKNKLTVYEVDDSDTLPDGKTVINNVTIEIHSHWNWSDRFVLKVDGKSYTILRKDAENAIKNACNHD